MIEVLQFIFSDFWHFIGTLFLLLAICPWNNVKIRFGKDKGRPLTDRDAALMCAAADRLEELDERVAIMGENEVQVTMNDILRGGA